MQIGKLFPNEQIVRLVKIKAQADDNCKESTYWEPGYVQFPVMVLVL